MLPRCLHAVISAGTSLGMLVGSAAVAQTIAPGQTVPSQVTPQTLRPKTVPDVPAIVLPGSSATGPAAGNSSLTVEVGAVQVQDAFPELAGASEAVLEKVRYRRLSVAQIYAAAAELEKI